MQAELLFRKLCSQRQWWRGEKQHSVLAMKLANNRMRTAAGTKLEPARTLPREHVYRGDKTASEPAQKL